MKFPKYVIKCFISNFSTKHNYAYDIPSEYITQASVILCQLKQSVEVRIE